MPSNVPWRVSAKVKADHAAAKLDQIEASYGIEDAALKLTGAGELRFGASPLLHAALSARQLDADRFAAREMSAGGNAAKQNGIKLNASKDNAATDPVPVLPVLRAIMGAFPEPPIPTELELAAEQIVLGGRSVQNFAGQLRSDTRSWAVDRLELRAPGSTRVSLSGKAADGTSGRFKGALTIEFLRPRCAGDVAARAERGELSQPESVSPER